MNKYSAFWCGLFSSTVFIVIAGNAWWEGMELLEVFAYHTIGHFTDQNWSLKPCIVFHDCIRCVKVCKIGFRNWNPKNRTSVCVHGCSYYNKPFRTVADRHNSILMSLFLVAETIIIIIIIIIIMIIIINHFLFQCKHPHLAGPPLPLCPQLSAFNWRHPS